MRHRAMLAVTWLACLWAGGLGAQPAPVDLTPFLKRDQYERVKISPDGEHLAVTVPLEDRTALVVLRRSDMEPITKIVGRKNSVVHGFWWTRNDQVVVSMAHTYGSRDQPVAIGELHAVEMGRRQARLLASPYGIDDGDGTVATYKASLEQAVYMLDPLVDDPRNILVYAMPLKSDPHIWIERLDVQTRRRTVVAPAPVERAGFLADARGEVRFAHGADTANVSKLYYRDARGSDWRLINDEQVSGHRRFPLGFSADGGLAYLQVERDSGPDAIVSWDPATGASVELLRDEAVDPHGILYDLDGRTPIGAAYMTDRVYNRFFDESAPTVRLYRTLEKVFGTDAVRMTSATADGRLVLLHVWSDRNNGDYFLFDTQARRAGRMFSRREWFDPARMPPSRYVTFQARDGVALHGYVTEPLDGAQGPRPMVLLPHGGPFGVYDAWGFDDDAQILAAAGYTVLRVNYRGSGNYGRAHMQAGMREWGGRMQDDLTDATGWAVAQGIADPSRICIYGASYGGYAALMGAAREPELYRCAAGYVGVYDLELLHRDASNRSRSGRTWALEWMGSRDSLAQRSPSRLADRIRAPVFLAAGGADERAPIEHSRRMEKALRRAGVPVETLYFPTEGHGFYTEPHRREYYTRLLAFLSRHLGGAPARE